MKIKLAITWDNLRTSYWFLPGLMSIAAAGLAVGMLHLDGEVADRVPQDAWWLYGGNAEGARAVLGAIISSMVSVTGVVFSITIVALTLAAGQFGSRLLRNFMRDRASQAVLGMFIATFVYALLVLRAVRGGDAASFVPPLSVTVAVVMVVAAVGVLIFFIHHIATSIQADSVVAAAARDAAESIRVRCPLPGAFTEPEDPPHTHPDLSLATAEGASVTLGGDDYLQAVDNQRLVELAAEHDVVIYLRRRPGDYVMFDEPFAYVVPSERATDELVARIRGAAVVGGYRTLTQDPEFGVLQLVEIAVRALSPGINDPFTAITCLDRISSLLVVLASRRFRPRCWRDNANVVRLIADETSFSGFADSAFDQIRQNATSSTAVLVRMIEVMTALAPRLRTDEQRASIREHARLVLLAGAELPTRDRSALEHRHAKAVTALTSSSPS